MGENVTSFIVDTPFSRGDIPWRESGDSFSSGLWCAALVSCAGSRENELHVGVCVSGSLHVLCTATRPGGMRQQGATPDAQLNQHRGPLPSRAGAGTPVSVCLPGHQED